jgi:uncharacterized protein YpbB
MPVCVKDPYRITFIGLFIKKIMKGAIGAVMDKGLVADSAPEQELENVRHRAFHSYWNAAESPELSFRAASRSSAL